MLSHTGSCWSCTGLAYTGKKRTPRLKYSAYPSILTDRQLVKFPLKHDGESRRAFVLTSLLSTVVSPKLTLIKVDTLTENMFPTSNSDGFFNSALDVVIKLCSN